MSTWSKTTQRILEQLKKFKTPRDRLEAYYQINFIISALDRSLIGWKEWLKRPGLMNTFNLDELKDMSETLKNFTIEFINFDKQITTKKQVELAVKKVTKQKKSGYIS